MSIKLLVILFVIKLHTQNNVLKIYRKVVKELSERGDILKADKGRGVVIMNRDKYMEKCLQILNTNKFVTLNSDPTKTTERKVQNVLRKIKSKFSGNVYKQLYPIGSSPGKFYGQQKYINCLKVIK